MAVEFRGFVESTSHPAKLMWVMNGMVRQVPLAWIFYSGKIKLFNFCDVTLQETFLKCSGTFIFHPRIFLETALEQI